MRKSESFNRVDGIQMRDEILNDSYYLSVCVMKCLWRGELGVPQPEDRRAVQVN